MDCIRSASMKSHAWLKERLGERGYYMPWVSMLDSFVATFRTFFAKYEPLRPIHDFRFYRYDRIVQHNQSKVRLKPDVLGLPSKPVLDEESGFRALWEDVFILGEAKFDNFLSLIH
jgi:hypothetical protein